MVLQIYTTIPKKSKFIIRTLFCSKKDLRLGNILADLGRSNTMDPWK